MAFLSASSSFRRKLGGPNEAAKDEPVLEAAPKVGSCVLLSRRVDGSGTSVCWNRSAEELRRPGNADRLMSLRVTGPARCGLVRMYD